MKQRFLRAECLEPRAMLSASLPTAPALAAGPPTDARPAQDVLTPSTAPQSISLVGDFNGDNVVNAVDIDMLTDNFGNNVESVFDITADGLVDRQDMDMLIRDVIGTEYGDADLDGYVGAFDAFTMLRGMMAGASGWAAGDFSCDGIIDGQDFIEWNRFKFTQTPLAESLANPTPVAQQADVADHQHEEGGPAMVAPASAVLPGQGGDDQHSESDTQGQLMADQDAATESTPVRLTPSTRAATEYRNATIGSTWSRSLTQATHELAPRHAEARPQLSMRPMRFSG